MCFRASWRHTHLAGKVMPEVEENTELNIEAGGHTLYQSADVRRLGRWRSPNYSHSRLCFSINNEVVTIYKRGQTGKEVSPDFFS